MDTAETKTVARETGINQWIALISKVAPFSYLAEEELVEIADSFYLVHRARRQNAHPAGRPLGRAVHRRQRRARRLYPRRNSGTERFVGRISPGETVGEMGLISGEPRSATVRCLRDAEILAIAKKDWDAFAARHPDALLAITKTADHAAARGAERRRAQAVRTLARDHPERCRRSTSQEFAQKLVRALTPYHSVVCVTREAAAGRSLEWFREIEADHHHRPLSRRCRTRRRGRSSACGRRIRCCWWRAATSRRAVRRAALRQHAGIDPADGPGAGVEARRRPIKGTAGWLALHDFKMHHHIRNDKATSSAWRA